MAVCANEAISRGRLGPLSIGSASEGVIVIYSSLTFLLCSMCNEEKKLESSSLDTENPSLSLRERMGGRISGSSAPSVSLYPGGIAAASSGCRKEAS